MQGNKKDSFYYVYTLKEIISDCYFDSELETENVNVKIFKYVTDEGKAKYALWCPTSDSTKVPGYKFKVENGKYTLVEFVNERYNGKRTDMEATNGYLTVNISENPIFIIEN